MRLADVTGKADSDDWPGHKIESVRHGTNSDERPGQALAHRIRTPMVRPAVTAAAGQDRCSCCSQRCRGRFRGRDSILRKRDVRAQQAPASLHSLSVCAVFDETSPTRKLSHAANAGCHPLADRGNDLYESTLHPKLRALFWRSKSCRIGCGNPLAGPGAVVTVLRAAGHAVIASDLVDYGFPLHFQRDFLDIATALIDVEAIDYESTLQGRSAFVAHALDLCPRVVMLLRFAFLEFGMRRPPIFDRGQLARVACLHAIDCR